MILPIDKTPYAHLKVFLKETWGYVRHELLYLTWALMDVALITPVALTFMPWADSWPPGQFALWLLLLMFIPFNLARLMTYLGLPLPRQQRIILLCAFLVIIASVRTLIYDPQSLFDFNWLAEFVRNITEANNSLWLRDFIIFGLVGFAWWRGMRLVTREPEIARLGLRVRLGGLLFAPFVILVANFRLSWNVTPYLLLFLASALTAVSLTRTEQVERQQKTAVTSMTPRWVSTILGVGLLIVFSAGYLAFTVKNVSPSQLDWLDVFWFPLRLGGGVVLFTFLYLVSPLLDVLELVLQGLVAFWNWLFGLLFSGGNLPELPDLRPPENEEIVRRLLQPAGEPLLNWRLVILAALILFTILVVWTLGRLYWRNRLALADGRLPRGAGDQMPKEADKPGLGQQILQRLGLLRNLYAAASIRRIYHQMCQAAGARGYPRADSETPYEYLPSLAEVWPANKADAQLITEAFVKVRYGEFPETKEEFRQIEQAWEEIQRANPTMRQE